MPNLAFHIKVLDQMRQGLPANVQAVLSNNPQFAVLGAMGPDLLRYRPVSRDLAAALAGLVRKNPVGKLTDLPSNLLQELFVKPFGGVYALLFNVLVVPTWPVLNTVRSTLDSMDLLAQLETIDALDGIVSLALTLQPEINQLQNLQPTLTNLVEVIGQIITLRPRMELRETSQIDLNDLYPLGLLPKLSEPPAIDPRGDRLHEFLRWHRTGDFARQLLVKAGTDPRMQAYAYGWLCHVASSVTAEPLVNNITGGPYRTHWWRNRLVGNFVDSWTYGFYESNPRPTMNGDDPSPHYEDWPSLCSANLQDQFNIAGLAGAQAGDVPDAVKAMADGTVSSLPGLTSSDLDAIANLLLNTVNVTYNSSTQPVDSTVGAAAGFTSQHIKEAFVGAYAVYWFMTSGSGPLGNNEIGPPPAGATTPPSWISSGTLPSPQQAGLNTGVAACALILAILAIVAALFSLLLLAIIAFVALVTLLATSAIDWDQVRSNLYWIRKTLIDAENALRDALVWAGLAYPPPVLLGFVDTYGDTLPATDLTPPNQPMPPQFNVPATRGVPLCHTNPQANSTNYPTQMDLRYKVNVPPVVGLADANFTICPYLQPGADAASAVPLESDNQTPPQGGLINPVPTAPYVYPDYFVDVTQQLNNGILTPISSTNISNYQLYGGAVSNAIVAIQDAIQNGGVNLPNYNLDGDRGYGWNTWKPTVVSLTGIQITKE
jgi:hypothetical protein